MSLQKFPKYLAAASFALALAPPLAISGNFVVVAQDGRYRNGDYNRDRGYNDDRYYDDHSHQWRERNAQKRHERDEKEDLKLHQREERYRYGDSDELRHHQRHEREDLNQQKREERDDLKHHQRSERGGYNGVGRYLPNDGYYDDYRRSGSSGRRY